MQVTRFTELAEYAIAQQERKNSAAAITTAVATATATNDSNETELVKTPEPAKPVTPSRIVSPPNSLTIKAPTIMKPTIKSPIIASPGSPFRKFEPVPGQRGLMQRFLASKGRLVGISPFTQSSPTSNIKRTPSPVSSPPVFMYTAYNTEVKTEEKSPPVTNAHMVRNVPYA